MSESIAPNDTVLRCGSHDWFFLHLGYNIIGGFFLFVAFAGLMNVNPTEDPDKDAKYTAISGIIGTLIVGVGLRKNWLRVKWIEAGTESGIRWRACGRVWHYRWDHLMRIDTLTVIGTYYGKECGVADHRMTVTFADGVSFRFSMKECGDRDQYMLMFRYLELQEQHAVARRAGSQFAAGLTKNQKSVAHEVKTTFGPLAIQRGGLEWDGIFYAWDQIESCEVQQGFLIIKTLDGDEFFRRTADLGDWHTALERLEAARKFMAGQPKKTERARSR